MAENLVINGILYNGVESFVVPTAEGKTAKYILGDADTSDINEAVVSEAERVVNGMLPKMAANSLNFVAMSDMHEIGDGENSYDYVTARIRNGNLHAGQGAKLISDKIRLDFYANLGDYIYGSSATTGAQGLQCFVNARKYIHDVVEENESFLTPGNHDAMIYSSGTTGVSIPYSILSDIVGTYRYKDYDSKKVRVICLNTADNSVTSTYKEWISGTQLQWFANALDLSAKSNPSEWGIVILSHHPLDWGNIKYAANCLACYLEGSTFSITHDGVSVSKNFSGCNSAKIIAQFHGHVHGFRVDYINDLRSGSPVPTTVKRVAIPNACFERTNEYGENSGTDSNSIEFGETTSYEKVENDFSQDTAFCLVSIDLDNEIIYADCYGAGYDRVISYAVEEVVTYSVSNTLTNAITSNSTSTIVEGEAYTATISANTGYSISSIKVTMGGTDITSTAVSGNNISIASVTGDIVITVSTTVDDTTVSVTNNLTNASTSNSAATAKKGEAYSATITANSGYELSTVTITMNGSDVTSSVYADGVISISSVTGDIVITASAVVKEDFEYGEFTNLVLLAEESNSTDIYNGGLGYKNGVYSSSNASAPDGTDSKTVATGWIPFDGKWSAGNVLYIKGATLDTTMSHVRIYGCESDKVSVNTSVGYNEGSGITSNGNFELETLGDMYYKLTLLTNSALVKYLRVCLVGTGENLIITLNEPIHATGDSDEVTTYSVTNNLTNVTTSNSATSVNGGSSYSAMLTADSGYALGSVKVTMGGTDITSSALSYQDDAKIAGSINIANVTGDIVVTMTTEYLAPSSYTNLVPTLEALDSTSPFNGTGYIDDCYLSGATAKTRAGYVSTGLLPYGNSVYTPIYIKGVTLSTSDSSCRIHGYGGGKTISMQGAQGSALTNYFTIETLGTNYYKVTPTFEGNGTKGWRDYLRFSLKGVGADLIITLDEPIE